LPRGPSHRTVLVLVTYGSSGRRVITPPPVGLRPVNGVSTNGHDQPCINHMAACIGCRFGPSALGSRSMLSVDGTCPGSDGWGPSAAAAVPSRRSFLSYPKWFSYLLPPLSPLTLSLPVFSCYTVGVTFPPPCGTAHRSLICGVVGFRSCVLRPTAFAGPGRPPRVRPTEFMTIPSPLPSGPDGNWALLLPASSPVRVGLTALHFRSRRSCTYDFQPDVPSRVLLHDWLIRPGAPSSRPCHSRCWVPSVRAPGLDFHLLSVGHADRTEFPRLRGNSRAYVCRPGELRAKQSRRRPGSPHAPRDGRGRRRRRQPSPPSRYSISRL
jgi:hypothetical protein